MLIFVAGSLLAETVTVITKDNAIREYAKFFAPVKANVKYNDRLEILATEGDWYRVRYGASDGYIHKSAVEKRAKDCLCSPNSSLILAQLIRKSYSKRLFRAFFDVLFR